MQIAWLALCHSKLQHLQPTDHFPLAVSWQFIYSYLRELASYSHAENCDHLKKEGLVYFHSHIFATCFYFQLLGHKQTYL